MGLSGAISTPNTAGLDVDLEINVHLWIATEIYIFQSLHGGVGSNSKSLEVTTLK